MTFVGKILVIVITAFALLFLGISTVVFTTAVNWKQATEAQKKKVNELQAKNGDLGKELDKAKKDFEQASSSHKQGAEKLKTDIATRDTDIKRMQTEITDINTKLETAQQNAKTALGEVERRREETDRLREQKAAVETQANEYKIRQTELNDKIRELSRMLETATKNATDLRDRVAKFASLLRQHGLSDDISTVKGQASPPVVQGEVARVDVQSRRLEITIGSDDGLFPGHELFVYRTKPRPEYLGKIQIISTDPDQAVAKVLGTTVQGKKIQEGDIVSTTIRPRS